MKNSYMTDDDFGGLVQIKAGPRKMKKNHNRDMEHDAKLRKIQDQKREKRENRYV